MEKKTREVDVTECSLSGSTMCIPFLIDVTLCKCVLARNHLWIRY